MRVELCNGKTLHFTEANHYEEDGKYLYIQGRRKRHIATIQLCFVAGWWYDNEVVQVPNA